MAKQEYKCDYCGYKTVNLYGSYLCPTCRHVLKPTHPQKTAKPLQRRWWFWMLIIVVVGAAGWHYKDAIKNKIQNVPQIIEIPGISQGTKQPNQSTNEPKTVTDSGNQSTTINVKTFNKDDCIEIDYKTVLRYPDKYKNMPVKATVVVKKKFENNGLEYYTCYGYEEGEALKLDKDKVFVLYDYRDDKTERVLVDDVIKVYGTFAGIQTIERVSVLETVDVDALMIKMMDSILISEGG